MKRVIALLFTRKEAFDRLWSYNLKIEVLNTLRTHALLTCIIFIYLAACVIIARIYGVTDEISLFLYFKNVCILGFWCFLFFFIGHFFYVKFFVKPDNFKEFLINDLQTNYLNAERLCNLLLIGLLLPVFMSAFTSYKIILPAIHPFSWDYSFAKLDAFIHGGKQPWQLLQPVLGHPLFTSILSLFYNLWFFVMYGVLFWQAFSLRDKPLRMQFLLTFVLLWIFIGSITATVFSSAGPCYYGRFVKGEDIFRPLIDYLYSAREFFPVLTIDTQELLWRAYDGRETGLVKGISAMPSMHVSIAFLFVLVGRRINRFACIIFSTFAGIIIIGCIHLGWHYAIDGYVAIIMTLIIWWTVGLIVKRNSSSGEYDKNTSEYPASQ
ncbi:MAG: phosphatase PAP2 family protein [Sedimentisphaerales bacterium]|nr:phosphatase PAP2 family protein [Sedimentisphaerales bacterium]